MKKLLLLPILIIVACSSTPKNPPSQAQIDAIQRSLDIEGEDRWANWKATNTEGVVNIRVAADPIANAIAISGYIDLIAGIHQEHAPKSDCWIRISQWSELKKSKYIKGK